MRVAACMYVFCENAYINIITYKNVNVSILFGLYQDKMTMSKKKKKRRTHSNQTMDNKWYG